MHVVGLFVIACVLQGITAPFPGHTKICRVCQHPVKHPFDCTVFQKCKDYCLTDLYLRHHGEYAFTFTCAHEPACYMPAGTGPHIPPDHHHEKWTPVCRHCCNSTGCDQYSCAEYFSTTPLPTTPTTTTTTTTSTTTTTTATTTKPTTTEIEPSATTKHTTLSSTTSTSPAPPSQPCADNDSSTFTCADMQYFGYCQPNAGSGYALAQMKCRKTCGFCV